MFHFRNERWKLRMLSQRCPVETLERRDAGESRDMLCYFGIRGLAQMIGCDLARGVLNRVTISQAVSGKVPTHAPPPAWRNIVETHNPS